MDQHNQSPVAFIFGSYSLNSLACGVVSGDNEVRDVSECSTGEKAIGDEKNKGLRGQAICVELEAMSGDVGS